MVGRRAWHKIGILGPVVNWPELVAGLLAPLMAGFRGLRQRPVTRCRRDMTETAEMADLAGWCIYIF